MTQGDELGAFGNGQWGSRIGGCSGTLVLLKHFTYQMMHLTKTDGGTFDNDAKACSDQSLLRSNYSNSTSKMDYGRIRRRQDDNGLDSVSQGSIQEIATRLQIVAQGGNNFCMPQAASSNFRSVSTTYFIESLTLKVVHGSLHQRN